MKQAVIAILIGASVSFLTVLFQGILDLLHKAGPEIVGSFIGIGKFLFKYRTA